MNNWMPKNKTIRLAAVVAFVSIVLYVSALFVVLGEIKEAEDFYGNSESESSKEEKVRTIRLITESNKEPIESLRGFFVKKGDEAQFIERIEEVARSSQIEFEITSIDVKQNQKDSFKEDVSVKMGMEGSWKNSLRFLDGLEKMSFGAKIEEVDLYDGAEGGWSGLVSFVVYREK